MIVNAVREGWKVIFQRNHALLAGAIASQVRHEFRPPNWIETLCAIMEHDDGQVKWSDKNHLTDAGRPLDFTMNEFDAEQARNVVMDAVYKSRWIALLTSMHTSSLYGPLADKNPAAAEFIARQKKLQFKLRKAMSVSLPEMERYYRFMRWCDECSLILCQDRLHNEDQRLEIGSLAEQPANFIYREGDVVHVSPWCFENDHFEVSAEFQVVKQLQFKSTEEFKSCLDLSLREKEAWQFKVSPTMTEK